MLSKKTTTAFAVLGLASSLAAAVPTGWSNNWSASNTSSALSSAQYSSAPSSTRYFSFPTEVSPDGDKFRYPLSNAFPTPNPDQLTAIDRAAHGTLSNNTPPSNISANGITNLEFVAFNELFEVAFFTSLLQNITTHVPGYEVPSALDFDFLVSTLTSIQAQEQLHALNANNGLRNIAHLPPITPCTYTFPSRTLADAILLAQTFTDTTLGTLQDIIAVFASSGDAAFVRGVAASLGNEGEQNGFFRLLQGKRPSAQPFLSASARELAFSALVQKFVVAGSCADIESGRIALEVFEPLRLETNKVEARDQMLEFSFVVPAAAGKEKEDVVVDVGGLRLVLVNGQNKPVVAELEDVRVRDGKVTFRAPFAFQRDLLFGLTIAAVARGEAFANVNAVERATVFGPALIEVL